MGSHKKLKRDTRKCIVTVAYDNMSIQEIGDKMGVSHPTIYRELQQIP